jgi:ERCC4-type nuclease
MPIFFERKSVADLFATLSNEDGIRRHKIKIEKAKAVGAELYLIIDGTLTDVLDGTKHSKVEPDPLLKRVFTFKVKYGLHPIFCQSPDEMVRYMIETWEAWGRNFKSPLARNYSNGSIGKEEKAK